MTEKILKERLINTINNNLIESPHAILLQFKLNGGEQQRALAILNTIIEEFKNDEKKEDLALEIMDIATGFCSPHQRIWDTYMKDL